MYFKLGLHLFSSKTLSNVLLIILIALSLTVANVGIGIINVQFSAVNAVENFDKQNTYYYMLDSKGEAENDIQDIISKKEISDIFDSSLIYYGGVTAYRKQLSSYSKSVEYVGVNEYISRNLNCGQLSCGTWYTDAEKKEGCLNVVALEGAYNVGDHFYISIVTDEADSFGYLINKNVECIVTGLMKKGTNLLYPTVSANSKFMKLSYMMTEGYAGGNIISYIYFSYEDEAIKDNLKYLNKESKCFLYERDPSVSNVHAIDELITNGWVSSIDNMCNNTYEDTYNEIVHFVPLMFGIFLLTIVCLMCIMTLNSTDYMRTYSIYYLCGMNWADMRKILISYSLIIMVFSSIITASIIYYINVNGGFSGWSSIKENNIYITLVIIVSILVVMVAIPYIMLSKVSPKDALQKN